MKRALCIGINDYPGTENDLAGCVNDAIDWLGILAKYDFDGQSLLNTGATRSGILSAIEDEVQQAKKGDSLVITYSGHGSFVPDEDGDEDDDADECLCPYDVVENGPIVDDELAEIFDHLANGAKCVFISDSCHSGTVTKMMPILTPPTMTTKKAPQRTIRFLPPSFFLPKKDLRSFNGWQPFRPGKKESKVLLMAGCQDWEYSYDAYFQGRPNGAFTFVALKALQEMPEMMTYGNWFKAIRQMLPSRQYPQAPNMIATSVMKRWKVFS